MLAQVKKSLAWRYQFGDAPLLPAKSSVTQLTHPSDEYVKFDYSQALDRQPAVLMSAEADLTRPVGPRLIGAAVHLIISQLDLTGAVTKKAIEKTKEKLLSDNAFSASVAEHIDTEPILAFFAGDLGRLAFDSKNRLYREWPFTFALPTPEWQDSPAHDTTYDIRHTTYDIRHTTYEIRDTIIVQGIIDMLIRTPQGLVVIDFKTDRVTASQVPQRAELYRRQLDLYSRAASAILKDKLIAKWLYFLSPACAFEIK